MNPQFSNDPDVKKAQETIQSLMDKFMATPQGAHLMAVAEQTARSIVKSDADGGVPFGELSPFVTGAIVKGIIWGIHMGARNDLTHDAWHHFGGCALAIALVCGVPVDGKPNDHFKNN